MHSSTKEHRSGGSNSSIESFLFWVALIEKQNWIMKVFKQNKSISMNHHHNKSKHSQAITACSYDMEGHTETCVDTENFLGRSASTYEAGGNACMDDPHVPLKTSTVQENWHLFAGSLVSMRVFGQKCRLNLLWSVNLRARSVTQWNTACGKRLARLRNNISHMKHNGKMFLFKSRFRVANLDYFMTRFLQETCKIPNQLQVEYFAYLDRKNVFRIFWMCTKQRAVTQSSGWDYFIGRRLEDGRCTSTTTVGLCVGHIFTF